MFSLGGEITPCGKQDYVGMLRHGITASDMSKFCPAAIAHGSTLNRIILRQSETTAAEIFCRFATKVRTFSVRDFHF